MALDAKPLVVHITTIPTTLAFLRGQTRSMLAAGFRVLYVSSPGPRLSELAREEGIEWATVPMARRITPLQDVSSVIRLVALLRRLRPAIVHAHTPKAGLLGMVAAWVARVPVRIYHLHGFPQATARGVRRWLLTASDRLACAKAHRVNCVSRSVRTQCERSSLCDSEKLVIHANGMINGIDAAHRFNPERTIRELPALRQALGIPPDAPVLGFVGRLVRDKGIMDLLDAWTRVREEVPGTHLLLVGRYEDHDPLPMNVREAIGRDGSIHHVSFTADPAPYFGLMQVLALPSYREGFPYVPMEAAAMRVPVVTTRVCGCVDAVVEGETGAFVEAGDSPGLAAAILRYLRDPELRARHGNAARDRVVRSFAPEPIWESQRRQYVELLTLKRKSVASTVTDGSTASGSSRPLAAVAHRVKRLVDVVMASALLVLVWPIVGAAAIAVRLTMGRPVLFRQTRAGLGGRPFRLVKLRTMREEYDANGRPRSAGERLTRLGSFLRATSVDELPQLWNVLTGDLSLVGPRPLLMKYLERYSPIQARRHEVKPGITGWAQVNGRNAISWDEKFALDVWYVDHRTLWLDFKILVLTVHRVLLRRGVSQAGHVGMPEFLGTPAAEANPPRQELLP